MRYFIEFTEKADKELNSLMDKRLRKNIWNKIQQLKTNPKKGKHLFKNIYELKAKNYRIYYELFRGIVVIAKVEYKGKLMVKRIGTKNTQKRDVRKV